MLRPNKTLGENIAHYRKTLNLTQAKLSTITGIRPKHLSDIESGKTVRIHTLARLAAGLGVTMDELSGMR